MPMPKDYKEASGYEAQVESRMLDDASEMAASGFGQSNPDPYAVTGWKSPEQDLRLPSGQLCLIKKLSPAQMIREGVIDDFDTLSSMVQTEHIEKKSKSAIKKRPARAQIAEGVGKELMSDPAKLAKAFDVIDKIVMACVVLPKIYPALSPGEEPAPGRAYIDWVVDEDKVFIMNHVFGGIRDLEPFREELEQSANSVDSREDLESPS